MNDVFTAALFVQSLFADHGWDACVIGGLAVIRWGNPRTTQDADFSLLTGFGDEEKFINAIIQALEERETGDAEFAKQFRVFRGLAPNGTAVDIALAGMPFEQRVIERATEYEFIDDCRLTTCSCEDLIVMKSFAERDKDWADVANVAAVQLETLDWDLILAELDELCVISENVTAFPKLESLRQQLDKESQ